MFLISPLILSELPERLADELRKPARAPDFAAVGLTIFQDLDALDSAGRIERYRVIDVEMFSDHAVEDEKPGDTTAGLGFPDPAGLHLGEMRGRREGLLLCFLNRKIPYRVSRRSR